MDDFREWLSDNLRYIMLGAGILLLLILIFFGIRFISSLVADPAGDQVQTEEDAEVAEATPTATPTPEAEPVVSDKLEKNAVPEVFTLVGTYYNAIASKDVETIRGLVDNLTAEDEATITNNTVEGYSNINAYTLAQGNGAYATFVSYKYKLAGIGTLVPGVAQLYICPDENGDLYICTATPDAETQAFIDESVANSEVQALVAEVQAEFDAALASDATLNAYFNPEAATEESSEGASEEASAETAEEGTAPEAEETPEPTPTPEPEYETVVLKQGANFRDQPSMKGKVIHEVFKGTEMLKLGEDGGWFHVRIDGVDGYIAARFF